MLRGNAAFEQFERLLGLQKITMRLMWTSRRPSSQRDDLYFVSFIGDGFKPAVCTAVIIDYGDGYGFFPESATNLIVADVNRIVSTREHPVPVPK